MTTLSSEHAMNFLLLANAMSPENLSCDGEATKKQVIQRRKTLMGHWRQLEKTVGRKVTEDEVYQQFLQQTRPVRMVENDPLTVKMTKLGVIFVIYAQIDPKYA